MSDFSVAIAGEYPICEAPVDLRPDGTGDPSAIDSPHGLGEALSKAQDVFTQVTTNPIAYIKEAGVLSQLFDRPGSLHEMEFSGPLLEGVFLSDLKVNPNTWMHGSLRIKDGYPEGEFNFWPPAVQLGFNPEKDLPSNSEFALLHLSFLDEITLDIDVHKIRIVTETDPNDSSKKVTRFKALISFMAVPGYTYREIDVTELITRRYLGDANQTEEIKVPFSRFVEMAATHIQSGAFENLNMFDPAGIRFNIKTSSDGTLPVYDGPHQMCADNLNRVCSSLQYHWDSLSLGNGIALHDVDAQVFVFPNPLTNGYVVEIPRANVGKLIQNLDPANPSFPPDPTRSITLSNAGIQDLILEVVPKDPNNLLAGVYIKEGKGKLHSGGGSVLTDVLLGSMGSGLDFEVKGDESGNLSAHLSLPGTILHKADLFLMGAVSTQVRNNYLYDGSIDAAYTDGVFSYDASFQSNLMCTAAAGTTSFLDFTTAVDDFSCRRISASSKNIFDSHRLSLNRCEGSVSGSAKLFSPFPLQSTFDTRFSGFDADLTAVLPARSGAFPQITVNRAVIPEFDLVLNAGLKKYKAHVNLQDAAKGKLNGSDIDPGLTITTDASGVMTARMNVKDNITFKAPEGTLKTKGRLIGSVELVNIAAPGEIPQLRPKVGSLRFETDRATFVTALGQKIRLKDKIVISDDSSGKITITARNRVTDPLALTLNTKATVTPTQSVKPFSAIPGVSYYDLPDGMNLSFTTKLSEPHLNEPIVTTGTASVAGLRSGQPQVDLHVKSDLGKKKIKAGGFTVTLDGGGLDLKGNEKKVGIDMTPPKTIGIDFSQVHDGVTYEFSGTLKNNASFHADVENPFSLGKQKIRMKQSKRGTDPTFSGTLTIAAKNAQGDVIGKGKIDISTEYQVEATLDGNKGTFSLVVPKTGLSGEVIEDFTIAGITAKKGSKFNIPIKTFKMDATFDPRTKKLASEMTISDFGPAELTILDSPFENLPQVPMKGPVQVTFGGGLAGQKILVKFDPKNGLTFDAVAPMQPTTLQARIKVGDDVDIVLDSETKAGGLGGSVSADFEEISFKVTKLALESAIDGKANVQGLAIDLNDLDTQALMDKAEIVYNRKTGEIRFRLDAPQPQGVTYPPDDFDSWMEWTKKQWEDYRKQMNAADHMVVLSEKAARLPGSSNFIPRGRGKVYIDLDPKTYTVNVNDFKGSAPLALANLLGQVFGDAKGGMRREYPNPPAQSSSKQSIIYNEGQDTLFVIDQTDTKLIERIQQGLGIDPEEAQGLFDNGRIDLDYLVSRPGLTKYFSEDTVRGLMHAFFDDGKGDPSLFFYALEDLQANTSKMVNREQAPWTKDTDKKVRTALFSDLRKDRKDNWVEAEGMVYLPYDADAVYSIVGDPDHLDHWVPWLSSSEAKGKTGFTGEIFGGYEFEGTVKKSSSGSVKKVSYGLTGTGDDVKNFESDFIIVPSSKGGVFLFQRNVIDLKGNDAKIYKGKDSDLTPGGDPNSFPLKLDRLLSAYNRLVSPNQDPTDVFRFLQAVAASHLSDTLYERENRKDDDFWTDFRKYDVTTDSLSYVPGGLRSTIPPEEFLAYDPAAKTITLSMPKDSEKKKELEALLKKAFGDKLAAKAIQDQKIDLKDLKEDAVIKKYVPDESLESLAQYLLTDLNKFSRDRGYGYDPFTSVSERYLYLMADLRERVDDWTGENGSRKMDFRSFPERFHNWNSDHNKWKPGDGTDSVVYSVVPGDVDFEKLLEVTSKPEDFSKYVDAITDTKNVDDHSDPKRPDLRFTDSVLVVPGIGNLPYRIAIPKALQRLGNLGLAPWTWEVQPGKDLVDQGFHENEGMWIIVPLKGDAGFLVMRWGLLNTNKDGDKQTAEAALKKVPAFASNMYWAAKGEKGKNIFSYGEHFATK